MLRPFRPDIDPEETEPNPVPQRNRVAANPLILRAVVDPAHTLAPRHAITPAQW